MPLNLLADQMIEFFFENEDEISELTSTMASVTACSWEENIDANVPAVFAVS